jgi:hypothetical protein
VSSVRETGYLSARGQNMLECSQAPRHALERNTIWPDSKVTSWHASATWCWEWESSVTNTVITELEGSTSYPAYGHDPEPVPAIWSLQMNLNIILIYFSILQIVYFPTGLQPKLRTLSFRLPHPTYMPSPSQNTLFQYPVINRSSLLLKGYRSFQNYFLLLTSSFFSKNFIFKL